MRLAVVIAALAPLGSGFAFAAQQSPTDAAVAWLRDVASGKAEAKLGEATALSAEASPEDVRGVRSQLSRLRQGLKPEDLRPLVNKEDGDLAAVLVSQITNFDANTLQIHAVGLVRKDDQWIPAPIPSSFDSTGLSLRPGFLTRLQTLEDWMLKERSDQLVRLKTDIFSLLTDEMRKVVSPASLHDSTPLKLAGDFLAALAKPDMPAALALAGGLEDPRPTNWDETFQVLSSTLRKKDITHSLWRLLAAPEAVRVIVAVDDNPDEPLVSIVGIDPSGAAVTPRPRAVHLPLVRSKAGTWRVRLTHDLLAPATRPLSPGQEAAEDDAFDAEILAKFPAKLAETFPAAPSDNALGAATAIESAFLKGSLSQLIPQLDLSTAPEQANATLVHAAALWQRLHRRGDLLSPVLLEVCESGDDACALFQMFSGRDPAKPSFEKIYLRRGSKGWLSNPGFDGGPLGISAEKLVTLSKTVEAALDKRRREWWTNMLTLVGGVAADSAPTEDETRKLITEARKALAEGDAATALRLSACFDDDVAATRMLRNIGSDIRDGQLGEILGIHRAGRWAAASLRVPPPPGDDSADAYRLVAVVATPVGPRIMPELDLYDTSSRERARDLFNRAVWDRVSARLPDGARGELESIYEKHRSLSAADRGNRKTTE